MVWLTRIFVSVFFIAVVMIALVFMAANESVVTTDFFFMNASAEIGVFMVAAFIAGLLITLLASFPVIFAYKFRLRRAQKKQLEMQTELTTLTEPK